MSKILVEFNISRVKGTISGLYLTESHTNTREKMKFHNTFEPFRYFSITKNRPEIHGWNCDLQSTCSAQCKPKWTDGSFRIPLLMFRNGTIKVHTHFFLLTNSQLVNAHTDRGSKQSRRQRYIGLLGREPKEMMLQRHCWCVAISNAVQQVRTSVPWTIVLKLTQILSAGLVFCQFSANSKSINTWRRDVRTQEQASVHTHTHTSLFARMQGVAMGCSCVIISVSLKTFSHLTFH
jgi:hypothetical protein